MQMELRLDQDTLARQYNKELGIYEIHELWTDKDYYDGNQFICCYLGSPKALVPWGGQSQFNSFINGYIFNAICGVKLLNNGFLHLQSKGVGYFIFMMVLKNIC